VATPSTKPVTATRPVAKPVAKRVAKPATVPAPVAKPATVPTPVAKPATVPTPVAKPATVPTPVAKPATVPTPVAKPATVPAPAKKPVTAIPDLARKSREQLVTGLKQGQQLSLDAAQTWVNAISALPVMHLPTIPGLPATPDWEAATTFTFDVADDLLSAQRQFVGQLTKVLAPGKTA
jgi:hypothetical protein